MSQENVERIRAGFDAHNRGDLDFLVELYDPEAVFETLLLGTHHGNEAIRVIYEENQKTLSGYDLVPVELVDAGDKVVAVAQAVGSGPARTCPSSSLSSPAHRGQFESIRGYLGGGRTRNEATMVGGWMQYSLPLLSVWTGR